MLQTRGINHNYCTGFEEQSAIVAYYGVVKLPEPESFLLQVWKYRSHSFLYFSRHVSVLQYLVHVTFVDGKAVRTYLVEPFDIDLTDDVYVVFASTHAAPGKRFCEADVAVCASVDQHQIVNDGLFRSRGY